MSKVELLSGSAGLTLLGGWLKSARLPRIAEIVLVIILAMLLALTALEIFAPLPVPKGDVLAARSAAQTATSEILARNPFPKAALDPVPIDTGPALAETALDLTLTGVWPHESNGSAIIRRPDGKEQRFATGDEIVSGVILYAVYSDQVVIEQNGVRESLRFESKVTPERTVAAEPASPSPTTSQKIENTLSAGSTGAALAGAFKLAPATNAAGEPALALFAGGNRALFESAGLRDGDIVLSINGSVAPQSPGEALALLGSSIQTGRIMLVVEREGEQLAVALSADGSGVR